eukprot:101157_1
MEFGILTSTSDGGGLMDKLSVIDRAISDKIAAMELGLVMEVLIIIPTLMFSPVGIPLFIAFNILVLRSFVFVVSMLLGVVFSEGIKRISCRPRPKLQAHKPLNVTQYLMHVESFSMPSGDVLQSAVFAVVVTYHLNQSLLAYVVVPWATFGRVYWGNHWLGDCLVGAAIGTFVSFVICINFETFLVHNFW